MRKREFSEHTYEEHVSESMRWRKSIVGVAADNGRGGHMKVVGSVEFKD